MELGLEETTRTAVDAGSWNKNENILKGNERKGAEEKTPGRCQSCKLFLCKWWICFLKVLMLCGTTMMAAGIVVTICTRTAEYAYFITIGMFINILPSIVFLSRACQLFRKRYLEYKGTKFKPRNVPEPVQGTYNQSFMELEMEEYPLPSGTLELHKGE